MATDTRVVPLKAADEKCAGASYPPVWDRALVCLMVVGLYTWLMQSYPIIYGGDPVARLVNFPRILNGHQLPLLQALLYLFMRWFYSSISIFLLMALISAFACAGLHALVLEMTRDRRAAWLAAVFYATHSFILFYSRVPYQEPLLMAGTFWGFYYLFRPPSAANRFLSSLFIAVACFSRYEGWIAAVIAALYQIRQDHRPEGKIRFLSAARSLMAFGWAPALWILWNRGLSPAGTYVLDIGFEWGRLYRPYFIAKSALWWTESAVVLLALIGLACSWRDQRRRHDGRLLALLSIPALLLVTLILSGHGIEPDATRIVTEREAFYPIGILVLYAGIGGSWLIEEFSSTGIRNPSLRAGIPLLMMLAVAGYGLNRGFHRVAAANADPDLKTDYEVANFLAARRATGLVFAAPLPDGPVKSYLRTVEKWGGVKGRDKAIRLLGEVETTPLDYQRVLMFSWLGKAKLFSGDKLRDSDGPDIEGFLRRNRIDYLVVFSGFQPVTEQENTVLSRWVEEPPDLLIQNGDRSARIYAVHRGL